MTRIVSFAYKSFTTFKSKMIYLKLALICTVFVSIDGSFLPDLLSASQNPIQDILNRLEASDLKWQEIVMEREMRNQFLDSRVKELRNQIDGLLEKKGISLTRSNLIRPKANLRTCLEILLADPSAPSGQYVIDPDGPNGEAPITVYCDMITGATQVGHNSESAIQIAQCAEPGCYSRAVVYNATLRQMATLSQLSDTCRQFIRFNCLSIPFEFNGISQAWWTDRFGNIQTYWAGPYSDIHTCQCGIDGNCIDPSVKCNCDTLAPEAVYDEGYVTEKSALPVTRLNFGRNIAVSSFGVHTLGRFECFGRASVDGPPKSCADLWTAGYSINRFYSVMGNTTISTVFCDFSKLPGEEGLELVIGEDDVKSKLVYFFATRNSSFADNTVHIPFEKVGLNEGEAFDNNTGVFTAPSSGIHFFTASFPGSTVGLYLDDVLVISSTNSLTATVSVDANQAISLRGSVASSILFNGALLQEIFPILK